MKSLEKLHLNEEQISQAVVDTSDLAGECRQHLSECQACRQHVERLREELFALGEYARLAVPPLTKTISLPREEPVPASHAFGWLPSFTAAVTVGLVLFAYFLGVETRPPGIHEVVSLEDQRLEFTLEDEDLMDEISQMVEYPLPDVIYEITGENDGVFDEFLQFVAPDNQDDFQS